jgi:hypothetical protein
MDRDLAIFQKKITVTAAAEGQSRVQTFRMYFIPSPTDGGLPDAADMGAMRLLQQRLQVTLHDSNGKWVCNLPITGTVRNIDPVGDWQQGVGRKFILAVTDAGEHLNYFDQSLGDLHGIVEQPGMITVTPRLLPENVLGYDSVDAIVWLDADPAKITGADEEKYRAIDAWVRKGGRLVICQPADWQKTIALGEFLPVTVSSVDSKEDLSPLREMARPPDGIYPDRTLIPPSWRDPFDPQRLRTPLKPPFRFAKATAKPGTVVDSEIVWPDGTRTPYVVRKRHGMGSVIWVAQDLGDPALSGVKEGWVYVWEKIFDWRNAPMPVNTQTPDTVRRIYEPGSTMDVGKSLIGGMDLQSKSAGLIALAVVFFIVYWLVAGPGVYAYLARYGKTHLSWFMFGACAAGATLLTVLIERLVLRGPPELKHFSIVRISPDQPANVLSRFGLYIPRDGVQSLSIPNATARSVGTIAALPIHPSFLRDLSAQLGEEYDVLVPDENSTTPPTVNVPYRSTLKKFQATWTGDIPAIIGGSARLVEPPDFIDGMLTNASNTMLRNIYFAFHYPAAESQNRGDWMLFLPEWKPTVSLKLSQEFKFREDGTRLPLWWTDRGSEPNGYRKSLGKIAEHWSPFWLSDMNPSPVTNTYDDFGRGFRRSLPMLSFFDCIAPLRNPSNNTANTRFDVLRRGARSMEMSQALSSGSLVILAEADGPLPIPLDVEGDRVEGTGIIYYQLIFPLDRSALAATTQPGEQ